MTNPVLDLGVVRDMQGVQIAVRRIYEWANALGVETTETVTSLEEGITDAATAAATAQAAIDGHIADVDPHTQYVETDEVGTAAAEDVGAFAAASHGSHLPDGATSGDLLYWNGSAWVVLASAAGVLTNDGAGNLSWV